MNLGQAAYDRTRHSYPIIVYERTWEKTQTTEDEKRLHPPTTPFPFFFRWCLGVCFVFPPFCPFLPRDVANFSPPPGH